MSPDRDEDLPELLDDLEATLAELRSDLRQETGPERRPGTGPRRTRRNRPRPGADLPRPPSVSELFRFTEQYTLPTLISTLEATIRALELLRGTLRILDPDRSAVETATGERGASTASRLGSGAAGVGREAISGVERALSELEAALAESDVPEDRASSELLGEARDLSAEVRERLDAAQETAGRSGRRQREEFDGATDPRSDGRSSGVEIEVTGDGEDPGAAEDGRDHEDRPEVDVEAELESIRHEVRGTAGADAADEAEDGDESSSEAESESDAPDGADDPGMNADESGDGGTDDGENGPAA
jgi:hypothetical protein